jgi:hypothetical protein
MSKLPWIYTEADELAFRSWVERTDGMPHSQERLEAEANKKYHQELPDNSVDKPRDDFKDVMIGH